MSVFSSKISPKTYVKKFNLVAEFDAGTGGVACLFLTLSTNIRSPRVLIVVPCGLALEAGCAASFDELLQIVMSLDVLNRTCGLLPWKAMSVTTLPC